MDLQAIIFDMDGVIVDTEFVDYQIQTEFVREENAAHGAPDSADALDTTGLLGSSYDALYRKLNELTGEVCPVEETKVRFEAFDAAKRANIDYARLFRPVTRDILNWAHEHHIKTAVASSSTREHIVEVLLACGIFGYFDVIESGEGLHESKPNPEIYLNALRELGVTADHTLAIEDSAHGIAAAKAAGVYCIGYRETRVPIDQSAADELADDMPAALQDIKRLARTH